LRGCRPPDYTAARKRSLIVEHLEAGTGLADLVRNVEQVAGRARQAIELRDDHHVARLQRLYELGELGPIASRTGHFLGEYFGAAGGGQFGLLSVERLAWKRGPIRIWSLAAPFVGMPFSGPFPVPVCPFPVVAAFTRVLYCEAVKRRRTL
jgi:hypothetical protein